MKDFRNLLSAIALLSLIATAISYLMKRGYLKNFLKVLKKKLIYLAEQVQILITTSVVIVLELTLFNYSWIAVIGVLYSLPIWLLIICSVIGIIIINKLDDRKSTFTKQFCKKIKLKNKDNNLIRCFKKFIVSLFALVGILSKEDVYHLFEYMSRDEQKRSKKIIDNYQLFILFIALIPCLIGDTHLNQNFFIDLFKVVLGTFIVVNALKYTAIWLANKVNEDNKKWLKALIIIMGTISDKTIEEDFNQSYDSVGLELKSRNKLVKILGTLYDLLMGGISIIIKKDKGSKQELLKTLSEDLVSCYHTFKEDQENTL